MKIGTCSLGLGSPWPHVARW